MVRPLLPPSRLRALPPSHQRRLAQTFVSQLCQRCLLPEQEGEQGMAFFPGDPHDVWHGPPFSGTVLGGIETTSALGPGSRPR